MCVVVCRDVVALSLDGSSVISGGVRRRGKKSLHLQVIWCESIGDPYTLKEAATIRRNRNELLGLQVMRQPWEQEEKRMTAEAERNAGLR